MAFTSTALGVVFGSVCLVLGVVFGGACLVLGVAFAGKVVVVVGTVVITIGMCWDANTPCRGGRGCGGRSRG